MENTAAIKLWNRFTIGNETALFLLNLPEKLKEDSSEIPKAVEFLRTWANELERKS